MEKLSFAGIVPDRNQVELGPELTETMWLVPLPVVFHSRTSFTMTVFPAGHVTR